jgi:hypothetical protein
VKVNGPAVLEDGNHAPGRGSAERRKCSGTQAEEPLPVRTVKCSPGVMSTVVSCKVRTLIECNFIRIQ